MLSSRVGVTKEKSNAFYFYVWKIDAEIGNVH